MNSFRVEAVLFDFDGVLVDSEPVRFKAGAWALGESGVSLAWERFLTVWLGRTDQATWVVRSLEKLTLTAEGDIVVQSETGREARRQLGVRVNGIS